jgi:hypothetical protein
VVSTGFDPLIRTKVPLSKGVLLEVLIIPNIRVDALTNDFLGLRAILLPPFLVFRLYCWIFLRIGNQLKPSTKPRCTLRNTHGMMRSRLK